MRPIEDEALHATATKALVVFDKTRTPAQRLEILCKDEEARTTAKT